MSMKKKIATGALLVAFGATAVTGATLAYFTDTDQKDNVFTVGNVNITLTEPNWDASGSVDAPQAYPGEALAKDPTVTNVGKNPCFVRIKVEGWDVLGANNKITYKTDYVANKLGDNWQLHEDGYFYHTAILYPQTDEYKDKLHETDALFDQIVVPTTVTNGFDGSYDIVVKAEAVQAQGAKPSFSAVETMTVSEIAAWFTTCGMDNAQA